MPNYRFRWDAFPPDTVHALAKRLGYQGRAGEDALAHLKARVARPNDDFVKLVKVDLECTWLQEYAGAIEIVRRLQEAWIGPGGTEPRSQQEAVRYLEKCRNSKRLRGLLVEAMRRFGDEDGDNGILDPLALKRFARIKPQLQPVDQRKPHPHQIEAWKALDEAAGGTGVPNPFAGLLVMPTGSGKTFTAVKWLISRVLDKGKRILWIAHRDELLAQAAIAFYELVSQATNRDVVRIRLVSGAFCPASMIDPADDVILASIASLARNPEQALLLTQDPDRVVVIDEAHHAPARSYVDLLDAVRARAAHHLLGLTATPTRTHKTERPLLTRLFGGKKIYEVSVQELIGRKILAEPIPVRVQTNVVVDHALTASDLAQVERFKELSEAHLERIAKTNSRNRVIINHYLEKRDTYGKTLVFAINVEHAAILAADFRKKGIRAEYIASYRPDEDMKTDEEILEGFRHSDLQVLINVNILTEGVDLPNIQTVFLTRPTSSEILVRQMIGRALRGKGAGGTEKAYLVSFQDDWELLRGWKDPFILVPDVVEPDRPRTDPAEDPETVEATRRLPWDLIRTIADEIWSKGPEFPENAFEAIPAGYYHASRDTEEDTVDQTITVYEHQRPCFEAFIHETQNLDLHQRANLTVDSARKAYFADCDEPQPSNADILGLLEMLKADSELQFSTTVDRELVDPHAVAKEIKASDLGDAARNHLIETRFGSPLAKAIYRSLRAYNTAISDALFEMEHPDQSTRIHKAIPVFEPLPNNTLRPGPHHDLPKLFEEMRRQGAAILNLTEVPGKPVMAWTKRVVKGVFATAHWDEGSTCGEGRIKVNVLLDSPDVTEETIRFLLWHEYLHLYLKVGHPPEFRKLEKSWPTWVEGDRELGNLHHQFGIEYW